MRLIFRHALAEAYHPRRFFSSVCSVVKCALMIISISSFSERKCFSDLHMALNGHLVILFILNFHQDSMSFVFCAFVISCPC